MNQKGRQQFFKALLAWLFIALGTACTNHDPIGTSTVHANLNPSQMATNSSAIPIPTDEPLQATPTMLPVKAIVNDTPIFIIDFEGELLRLQAAQNDLGIMATEAEQEQQVLDNLIILQILSSGSEENGFELKQATLISRYEKLVEDIGGPEIMANWLLNNYYQNEDSFLRLYRLSIESAWQRDFISQSVPESAEQINASQILLLDETTANSIYQQLENGVSFDTLVYQYDPITRGKLGWFPRGYLSQAAIEEAAFKLEPGQFSEVIPTSFGYHIIYINDRDPNYPLSPDARRVLQHAEIQKWVDAKVKESNITIY